MGPHRRLPKSALGRDGCFRGAARQFVAAMERAIAARHVPLSAIGDWLVTAATLLALRARLLLPPSSAEAREAEREAADRPARNPLARGELEQPQAGAQQLGRVGQGRSGHLGLAPLPISRPARPALAGADGHGNQYADLRPDLIAQRFRA